MKSQHSWLLVSYLVGIILLCGCRVLGTDDLLYASTLTQQKFDDESLLRDPNRTGILLCSDRADSEKVNPLPPCGVIPMENVNIDCECIHNVMVPSRRNKEPTRAGTGAWLYTICFRCPVFWGTAQIAPKRPRWTTLGEWPADGAVLRPMDRRNVGKTCVIGSKTRIWVGISPVGIRHGRGQKRHKNHPYPGIPRYEVGMKKTQDLRRFCYE
jgi:hypothetical protein